MTTNPELMSSAELSHAMKHAPDNKFRTCCGNELYKRDRADFVRRNKYGGLGVGPRRQEYYTGAAK